MNRQGPSEDEPANQFRGRRGLTWPGREAESVPAIVHYDLQGGAVQSSPIGQPGRERLLEGNRGGTAPAETSPAPIPIIDGFHFALSALLYDMFLCKRVYSSVPPGPAEVILLAMAVGMSLAALAWWFSPGNTYLRYRQRLLLLFRAYHLLACTIVPCSGTFTANTTPWKDFTHVLLSPGFCGGTLLLHATVPLPLRPALLVNAAILPFVFTEAYHTCNLPFVEPLREQMSAALRVLLHPAALRLLRGRLSALSVMGECHVVLGTAYFLGALVIPNCFVIESWTRNIQQEARQPREGSATLDTIIVAIKLDRLVSWWLRQPFVVRLFVYLLALQLAVVLAVAVSSLFVK